jgi:anti-sigma-K factor RskA
MVAWRGVGVTAALALGRDGDDTRVVSAVELERLGPSGSGRAELIDHDGSLQLRVDTSELDAGDGYLELWLIDPSVTRLVSLGPLRSDGVYDVPTGVDPAEFPIVDVSVEPVDGDPTHSGQSVLRGALTL